MMETLTRNAIPSDIAKGFFARPDDLSNLQLIDADTVRELAETLNTLRAGDLGDRKLVIALATGGTLAMKTEHGIRVPHFDFQKLIGMSDVRLQERFEIRGLQAFNLDSSQMDYRHVQDLAVVMVYLWNTVRVPFLGYLVTHGTDTMSYAGAATSLMMGQGMPFSAVYTGSQRPIDDPMTDAPANIRNALCALEALSAHEMAEILIAMGDVALLATSAEKVDDMMASAFEAPRHRHVANFSRLDYPVRLAPWLSPRRHVDFKPTIWQGQFAHTLVVKSTLGLDPAVVVQQIGMKEVQAVILYSYGASSVYDGLIEAAMPAAQQKKIPVFVVNPVHADYRVDYMSSLKAVHMGAVPLDMTLSSALAKIEIALRLFPGDVKAMSRFMTANYVGEIPTHMSRFSPSK